MAMAYQPLRGVFFFEYFQISFLTLKSNTSPQRQARTSLSHSRAVSATDRLADF